MTPPRDPRLRRQASAAALLEAGADAMRIETRRAGPAASAAQLGTVDPPLTAQEFADALGEPCERCGETVRDGICDHCRNGDAPASTWPESWATGAGRVDLRESSEPPPVAPVTPTSPAAAPALDWASRHDPRSLAFGVRAQLPGSAPLQNKLWPSSWPTLDQGAEGACVGMAVAGWANTMRDVTPALIADRREVLDATDARTIYKRAQQLDDVPGESYTGTSVLAGMKAGMEAGLFGGYLWAFGTRDVAQAVLQRGPVVVGVPWLAGMYATGPGGLVRLEGAEVGGHCLLVVGLSLKGPQGQPGPFFVWHNSWGDEYGDGGLGYVHHRDLATLLRGRGEAAIPTAQAQS